MQDRSFEDWMAEVDRIIGRKVGLGYQDLPDVDYRGLYQAGDAPEQAAVYAVRNAADLDTDSEEWPF